MTEPNFRAIPPVLHTQARQAWESKDAFALFMLASHDSRGNLLHDNLRGLKQRGMYERAVYDTYVHGPHYEPDRWRFYFGYGDREKLRACGDSHPSEPITVYRGVRMSRKRLWIRGLSWTTNPGIAAWFATRFAKPEDDPAVYSVTVDPSAVFFMTNERSEEEAVIEPRGLPMKRLAKMPEPYRAPDH